MSDSEQALRLAITMGDPAGIGPEVILKALASGQMERQGWGEVRVYGAVEVMRREDRFLQEHLDGYDSPLQEIELVEVAPELRWAGSVAGQPQRQGAIVQRKALRCALKDTRAGRTDAIVTAPWNKALFALAGEPVRGHTEVLAEACGASDVVMMLAGPRLRVALVTTHVSLREVAQGITAKAVESTLTITCEALRRDFGLRRPRVALCGLNPHAGESGHMGVEEQELIEPLLNRLRARGDLGADLFGPFPADTLFAKFARGQPYDAVVAMYHDQGLIPLKLLHFGESANITLGLDVVRTSVDHGTAYDIAGEGVADEGSMRFAMKTAGEIARQRREAFR
jgi:4-phospho-D-threonate 3-dehydrogenase / 4-phospho-D-erythronate 3-dehydrogenase